MSPPDWCTADVIRPCPATAASRITPRIGVLSGCHEVPELAAGALSAANGVVPNIPPPPLAVLAKPKATGEVVRDSDDALEGNARMLEQVLGEAKAVGERTLKEQNASVSMMAPRAVLTSRQPGFIKPSSRCPSMC